VRLIYYGKSPHKIQVKKSRLLKALTLQAGPGTLTITLIRHWQLVLKYFRY